MGAVAGQGTTFNLPNYHGELFKVSPTETPFLSAIGGLNEPRFVKAKLFEWQTIDRRASSANNTALEGADAPAAAERSRSNLSNVVEIHHSKIEVSYSRLAGQGYATAGTADQFNDEVLNELAIQTNAELESIAVDIEKSFLTGTFANPADNLTPRATQGVLGIAATVNANGGTPRAFSKTIFEATLKSAFDAGAKLPQDMTVVMAGAAQKLAITNAYATATLNMVTQSRTIGGLNIETIVTPFGTFGVMLNRWMPADQIGVIDLSVCKPVFREVPGKGYLFVEPLAKTGSSEKYQMYGEVGLEYGPTNAHALIDDLS